MVHLLLIGNAGVGKSFIGNALLQREVFLSSFDAKSVTTAAQAAPLSFTPYNGKPAAWTLVDMPGLMEADRNNLQRNEQQMTKAFAIAQGQPVVVAFIITLEGGRVRPEDVSLVNNVLSSVNGLTRANSFLIVNKVEDEESERAVIDKAVGVFPTLSQPVLVPKINLRSRQDLTSADVTKGVFQRVLAAALGCTAAPVRALSIHADRLAAERDRERERAEEQRRAAEEQQRLQRAKHEREAREYQQRERERQAEAEAKRRRETERLQAEQREAERREAERQRELREAVERRRREAEEERRREAAAERQREQEREQHQQMVNQVLFQQLFMGGRRRGGHHVVYLDPYAGMNIRFW